MGIYHNKSTLLSMCGSYKKHTFTFNKLKAMREECKLIFEVNLHLFMIYVHSLSHSLGCELVKGSPDI